LNYVLVGFLILVEYYIAHTQNVWYENGLSTSHWEIWQEADFGL